MATHDTLTSLFTDIADAIRGKTKGTAKIVADNFPTAIGAIATGRKFASGTKTLSSSGTTITISNIGFTPKIFMIFPSKMHYVSGDDLYLMAGLVLIDSERGVYRFRRGYLTSDGWSKSYMSYTLGATTTVNAINATFGFPSDTYYWYAIA